MGASPAAVGGANPATPASAGATGSPAGAGARTTGLAQVPSRRRAFIGGEDLQPIKARILLMLALTKTNDPAEIQRMFIEY
jgi:L-asparaginase